MDTQIHVADANQRSKLVQLLLLNDLPTNDLPEDLANFWLAFVDDTLVGSVGFEAHESTGLLRSLCVQAGYRNQSIARQLYAVASQAAQKQGITTLYLLTTTASRYFDRLGFETLSRKDVPETIQQTRQFKDICPSSAIVMYRKL